MANVSDAVENVGFVSQMGSGAESWVNGNQKVKPNDIAERQIEAIQEQKACSFNPGDWEEGSGDLVNQSDTDEYSMAPGVYSSTIRYYESISSASTIEFDFTPETNLINTVILFHDLFEIDVGDGDDYGTTLKANLGGPDMLQIGDRIIATGGIKVGTDVDVTIRQSPQPDNTYQVILSIMYTENNGNSNTVIAYKNFPIPSQLKDTSEPIRVSIGFSNVNVKNTQTTSAYFRCFRVS